MNVRGRGKAKDALAPSMPLAVLRARSFFRLIRDFVSYAFVNRAWWVLPVTFMLALVTVLVVVGQVAAPVTLYPMF